MALQSSGQISFSNIANEKGITVSNLSLHTLANKQFNTDPCNPSTADHGFPHALSEFYRYDHTCVTDTGPKLVEQTWLGFYRDTFEACERGQFNDADKTLTVYVDEESSTVYSDSVGKTFQESGIYYSLEISSSAEVDREGRVVYGFCDSGEPPKR